MFSGCLRAIFRNLFRNQYIFGYDYPECSKAYQTFRNLVLDPDFKVFKIIIAQLSFSGPQN